MDHTQSKPTRGNDAEWGWYHYCPDTCRLCLKLKLVQFHFQLYPTFIFCSFRLCFFLLEPSFDSCHSASAVSTFSSIAAPHFLISSSPIFCAICSSSTLKWEGAHHPYLQLGELNCEGCSSRGIVEGILKAPRAAALRVTTIQCNKCYGAQLRWKSWLSIFLDPQPTLSTFQVGGNRSTRRKPTTFGRALTNSSHPTISEVKGLNRSFGLIDFACDRLLDDTRLVLRCLSPKRLLFSSRIIPVESA